MPKESFPNFDARFADYTAEWMQKNRSKYKNVDDMEADMPEVYFRWLNAPAPWLDDRTPGAFFQQWDDAEDLAQWLEEYIQRGVPVPDPLLDRITDLGAEAADALCARITDVSEKRELSIIALGLLRELDSQRHIQPLLDLLQAHADDREVSDLIVEALQSVGQPALEPCARLLEHADDELAARLLDVCVQYPGIPAVYERLMAFFMGQADRALYASYLGKYGDANALPALYAAIDEQDIDYIEYLEMRNAIEALGGYVEKERDFSGDPAYESLRGV